MGAWRVDWDVFGKRLILQGKKILKSVTAKGVNQPTPPISKSGAD